MDKENALLDLDERAREVFRHIVDSYMRTGDPVGSRTLSRNFDVSPATIRNVMSDLEDLGLLCAPHVSAGRMPTDRGLRCFIDGILEIGTLSRAERAALEEKCADDGTNINGMLEKASAMLSGLSASAGLVLAPKADKSIRHIEFIELGPGRALAIIVPEDGIVENRIMDIPRGMTGDMLKKAGAFLSERLHGKTIAAMREDLLAEIRARRSELGDLTSAAIEAGLAIKAGDGQLIVRGHANLLGTSALHDLERIRLLMEQLEAKETVSKLLEEAAQGGGVKIYIGSENPIFESSGYAMILTPYTNASNSVIGAVGVIGPTRLNYAKIIPSIDVTADIIRRKICALSDAAFARHAE
ncbi:MAG: heat-inducible transcriptional repressor HrcA [Rhodospirillales bacterium]|nr:heat-inducible transcriptional repressor HrcA [Alphaproteobacteria bacterium]USO04653.1 MAG: heat-inducible transcriptional repressor HrcA [Rhodospirillales bacterium]